MSKMTNYTKAEFVERVDSGEDHESILLDIANQTVKNPDNKALLRSALQNPDKPMHPYDAEKFGTLFRDLKKRAVFVSDELGNSPVFDRKPTVSKQVKSIFAQRHEGQTHTASVRRPTPQSPAEPGPYSQDDDELAEYADELSEIDRDIQHWLSNQDRAKRGSINSSGSKSRRQFAKSAGPVEADDVSVEQLLGYLRQSAESILNTQGVDRDGNAFTGGLNEELPLRPTQRDSLEAFCEFLDRDDLSDQEKLRGFFEIPTGVGKTAIFVTLLRDAHKAAQNDGKNLRSAIVVPTIQLLWQTLEAVEEYAPELAEEVGLCGDNHKDLSQALTLMTYDSWMILAESGQLSSANTHILISDEAHRGTSVRKEESYFQSFSGVTANIGFTATSRFDVYKSAENVHKNLIFSRSIPESIRLGELCDYAQTQFYVIRVSPPRLNGEFKDAAELSGSMRQELRRQAWNKRAEAIFVEGVDMHTGDLISDNQAGFFTADTYHADDLEGLLNSNEVLAQRAKEQGKKGVAVAIHSRLSKKEQDRRLRAYTRGEYMAVIGDEKFKEGFDYPPMKTIIDWPHSSVVDKAQILGRGARKWWNDVKERYEGMTFIDTIVYVGSNDLEQDKKDRENAIAQATTARQILEDAVVYAEGVELAPKKPKKPKLEEEPTTSEAEVEGDINIHELPSADPEVNVVDNEAGSVTPQDIVEVYEGQESVPNVPSPSIGSSSPEESLGDGGAPTVEENEKIVLTPAAKPIEGQEVEEYAELEDVYTLFSELDAVIGKRRENWAEIDDDLKTKFQEKANLVGGTAGINSDVMRAFEWINHKTVYNIVYGRQASAPADLLDYIEQALDKAPKPKRILTSDERSFIDQERDRTGVGARKLVTNMIDQPEGITSDVVERLFSVEGYKASEEVIQAVLRTYPKLVFLQAGDLKLIEKIRKTRGVNAKKIYEAASAFGEDVTLSEMTRIYNRTR
ncbi:MAG: DEAD/DEAH box helicase [Alphaproteobacteria bacterium]